MKLFLDDVRNTVDCSKYMSIQYRKMFINENII